jgi:ATP-dependent RNA helicase RhlE
VPLNTFTSLGLTESLLRALACERLVEPTPIQASAIPHLLEGRDLLGIAQTGTGKTAAFALPLLQHLITAPARPARFATRAIVLAPTRELALQIEDSLRRFANQQALRIVVILGGVSRFMQVQRMRGGADIVVGTPGRICDLMATGELKLNQAASSCWMRLTACSISASFVTFAGLSLPCRTNGNRRCSRPPCRQRSLR